MSSSLTRLRRCSRGMPSVRLIPCAAESETFSFSPQASGVGANVGNWWIARTPLALRLNVSAPAARGLSRTPTGGCRRPAAVAALHVLRPHGQRRRFRRRIARVTVVPSLRRRDACRRSDKPTVAGSAADGHRREHPDRVSAQLVAVGVLWHDASFSDDWLSAPSLAACGSPVSHRWPHEA